MDLDALQAAVAQASLLSLGVAFAAGFLFSFNPVALAAIPVTLAYVTRAHETRRALLHGSMFILGMLLTHAALGYAAGLGGQGLAQLMGRQWGLVLGPLLIVLGLLWPGWLRLPLPQLPLRARRASGAWGAFALGIPFSVAVCPSCTPTLLILLGVAADLASPWFGMGLLLAFAAGRAVPVALGAFAVGWLESLKGLARAQKAFEVAGGLLLIASGLYLLNAYFFVIPALAN